MEPSRLLHNGPLLSLHSSQGSVLWAALKAQWAIQCEVCFQQTDPSLDDFVACSLGALEVWRAEKDMSLSRAALQHLISQLISWFDGGMFQQWQPEDGVFPRKTTA